MVEPDIRLCNAVESCSVAEKVVNNGILISSME